MVWSEEVQYPRLGRRAAAPQEGVEQVNGASLSAMPVRNFNHRLQGCAVLSLQHESILVCRVLFSSRARLAEGAALRRDGEGGDTVATPPVEPRVRPSAMRSTRPGLRVARDLSPPRGTECGLDVHNRKDGVLEQNALAAAETAGRKQRLSELPSVPQLEPTGQRHVLEGSQRKSFFVARSVLD